MPFRNFLLSKVDDSAYDLRMSIAGMELKETMIEPAQEQQRPHLVVLPDVDPRVEEVARSRKDAPVVTERYELAAEMQRERASQSLTRLIQTLSENANRPDIAERWSVFNERQPMISELREQASSEADVLTCNALESRLGELREATLKELAQATNIDLENLMAGYQRTLATEVANAIDLTQDKEVDESPSAPEYVRQEILIERYDSLTISLA